MILYQWKVFNIIFISLQKKIAFKIENAHICAWAKMVAREKDIARQQDKINIFFNFMLCCPAQFLLYTYSGFIPGKGASITKTIE